MRRFRAFFSMVVLLAVALLPGPSHALAAASGVNRHGDAPLHAQTSKHHETSDHNMHVRTVHAPHVGREANGTGDATPSHHPCKHCSVACCAPATVAVDVPAFVAAAGVRRLRPPRPPADRLPADALAQRRLKPPTRSAAA